MSRSTFYGALRAAFPVLAVVFTASALYSQVTTADILGRVTDPGGAVAVGATVTLENTDTGVARTTTTNESGDFSFTLLQAGNYLLRINTTGFKTYVRSGLAVATGDRMRVDVQLEIGEVTQTLEVTATTAALQTESSAVQLVVDQQAVQDLPLNGRNFFSLVHIQPGVNPGPPNAISSGNRPDDRRQSSTISANGQSDLYNNNMVDGLDNNELEQGFIGVRPSIDAISEVRVLTNNYTAEVGRAGGAVVNVITKSGTNALHGSLYEFLRNDLVDARNFFLSPALDKPKYRQNQFGGSLGGPIQKSKTFFFGAIENLRTVTVNGGQPVTTTVPTLFQQQNPGNFSDIGGPIIPVSTLDPIALAYFKLYPAPNQAGALASENACGTGCRQILNNYQAIPIKTQFGTTSDIRVDHRFSDWDNSFVRYSFNPVETTVPGAFPAVEINGLTIYPGGGDTYAGPSKTVAQAVQLNHVHIFRSNLVMELKAGFTRISIRTLPLNYGTNAAEALGVKNANVDATSSALSVMSVQNYATVGQGSYLPILDFNNVFQYAASVAYTRGAHDLRFGVSLIRRQLNYFQPQGSPQGTYTFNNTASGFSLPYTLSMANFLAGRMVTIARNNTLTHPGYRTWEPAGYTQDNWRATRWLTVNLGLRYEIFTPMTEVKGQYTNFDPASLSIQISNDLGTRTDYKNISPRVGFAATIGRGMVFSGGFGISYYRNEAQSNIQIPNPPYLYGYNCGTNCLSPTATLSNFPLPIPSAVDIHTGCPTTSPCLNLTWKQPDFRPARIKQFNAQVQKQIGYNVLTAGYVGVLGRNLLYESNYNQPLAPGAGNPTPSLKYATELRLVNAIAWKTNNGYSNYHSLQTSLQRRFRDGFTMNANYTFAHGLSNSPGPGNSVLVANDPSYDYGNSGFDIRHRIAVSANYQLPFASHSTGLVRLLLQGWQVNGIAYWQSGQPFTVTNGAARINLPGVLTDRPNMISDPKLDNPTIAKWFDTSAFEAQTAGTVGDQRPNQLHGPPARRIDISLFKTFKLTERFSLQFRTESYNITNTPNFVTPVSNMTSGNFGRITSTAVNETPRQFQFGLKLLF
jgi:hypothetical protein